MFESRIPALLAALTGALLGAFLGSGCNLFGGARGESVEMMRTPGGWVAAPRLSAGWDCFPTEVENEGAKAEMLKCKATAPSSFVFVLAKDYTVPDSAKASAEALSKGVFAQQYARSFRNVRVLGSGPVEHGGRQGWETRFDAESSSRGPITKVERVFVSGSHVMILSAEGRPEDMAVHQGEIGTWLGKARFANL
jgi:hypothetical protein